MHIDRHVELRRCFPEWVVIVAGKRQMLGWYLPNHAADHALLLATLELFDGVRDVIHRDHRDTEQPPGRGLAVIDHPIVSDLKTGFLQSGVFQRIKPQSVRRIQNFGADAVDGHLIQARLWIVSAWFFTGRVSRRKLWKFGFEAYCQVGFP